MVHVTMNGAKMSGYYVKKDEGRGNINQIISYVYIN